MAEELLWCVIWLLVAINLIQAATMLIAIAMD